MHNCTLHGLEEWTRHMFEKLGWMTLAARDKNKESVIGYLAGLDHLAYKILEKQKETVDVDRKKDLEELLENVRFLTRTSKKVLKV